MFDDGVSWDGPMVAQIFSQMADTQLCYFVPVRPIWTSYSARARFSSI